MWAKQQIKSGFTIVELLIVVVVIAILAAIAILSYVGIQDQAQRTQTMAAVNGWEKILRTYMINGGDIGVIAEGTCLSAGLEDFPAGDGFLAGRCGTDTTELIPSMITGFKEKSVATIPKTVLKPISYGSQKYRGVFAQGIGGLFLVYFLKGTTCLLPSDVATVNGNSVQCVRQIQ